MRMRYLWCAEAAFGALVFMRVANSLDSIVKLDELALNRCLLDCMVKSPGSGLLGTVKTDVWAFCSVQGAPCRKD